MRIEKSGFRRSESDEGFTLEELEQVNVDPKQVKQRSSEDTRQLLSNIVALF